MLCTLLPLRWGVTPLRPSIRERSTCIPSVPNRCRNSSMPGSGSERN